MVASPIVVEKQDSDALTRAIVDEVAAEKDVTPFELDPLYSAIDVEALQRLFTRDASGRVVFAYEGCEVEVAVDGPLTVTTSR